MAVSILRKHKIHSAGNWKTGFSSVFQFPENRQKRLSSNFRKMENSVYIDISSVVFHALRKAA